MEHELEVTIPESGSPAEGEPSVEQGIPSRAGTEQADLARAAELESTNLRVDEADRAREAEIERQVELRANQLLLEVFPQQAENQRSVQVPYADPETDQDDLTFEERLDYIEGAFRKDAEDRQIREQVQSLNEQVSGLEVKYPQMSRRDVLMVVAAAGDRPVNLDRIAAASHNTNEARLEEYHQRKLKAMSSNRPPNTPDPSRSAGTPSGEAAPKTYAEAKVRLRDRLRSMGWGRG